MTVFPIVPLFASVLCFITAGIVYHKDIHSKPNRIFALLCFFCGLWAFTEFLVLQSETEQRAEFWMLFHCVWPFTIALLSHFIIVFTDQRDFRITKRGYAVLYGPALFAVGIDLFLIDYNLERMYWGWAILYPRTQLMYGIDIWATLTCIIMIIVLIRYCKKMAQSYFRRQTIFIVIGISLVITTGIISEWIIPCFSLPIPRLTTASFAIIALIVAIVIRQHDIFTLSPSIAAQAIIETMTDSLIVVNMERRIEIVNEALVQLLGYERNEVLGKGMEEILGHFHDEGRSLTEIFKAHSINDIKTTFRRKNGTKFPVSLAWSVLRDNNRRLRGVVFIARDMSDRERTKVALQHARDQLEKRVAMRTAELKRANDHLRSEIDERQIAEDKLAAEKERLAVTLRSIEDGVITVATSGTIMLLNTAAEIMTGWKFFEAEGKRLDVVYKTKEKRHEIGFSVLESPTAHIHGRCALLAARDSTEYTITETVAPLFDRSGNQIGNIIVFRDITDKLKLENELFKARKLESIGLLASGVAHDFNNILTGIITNLFMAKIGADPKSDIFHLVTSAEKAAFKATSLTNQLLTFARGGAPVKENASIKELIEDSVGFYLSGSRVDYNLDLSEDLDMVEIDRGQIDQVLNNIIINADQAMPDGGTIAVRAENDFIDGSRMVPLSKGNYVKIAIQDQGIGIPVEHMDKIFDPYFSTRSDGTGLGLTIAYAIVQKHSGHISVHSEVGKGTTFSIYLPATKERIDKEEPKDILPLRGKGRVLLMDDEEYIRKSAGGVLCHLGYDVSMARCGREVLNLYREAMNLQKPFGAVIMDLTVPGGMGGKETITKLLSLDPGAKVIVSSGYTNDPVMLEHTQYGFCAAATKPYNIEDLSVILQSVLESAEAPYSKNPKAGDEKNDTAQ